MRGILWLISLSGGSPGGTLLNISTNFVNQRSRRSWTFMDSFSLLRGSVRVVSMAWTLFSSPPSRGGFPLPRLRPALSCEGAVMPGWPQFEVRTDRPSVAVGACTCNARFLASIKSSCPDVNIRTTSPCMLTTSLSKSSTRPCLRMKGVPIIISYQSMLTTSM